MKWLIIITTVVYMGQFATKYAGFENAVLMVFALTPGLAVGSHFFWQAFTYLFLHATNDPMHLVLNMLGLWMFGSPLEQKTPPACVAAAMMLFVRIGAAPYQTAIVPPLRAAPLPQKVQFRTCVAPPSMQRIAPPSSAA